MIVGVATVVPVVVSTMFNVSPVIAEPLAGVTVPEKLTDVPLNDGFGP